MSAGSDTDGVRQGAVPAPRDAELPLPPSAVPGGPHDGDIADGLEEAYWSVYDGAASKATVGQILARLPRIVRQIGRLAWNTDRTATIAVVVLQLASAAMTAPRPDQITVLISHRLASVVSCDRVFVFDGGCVTESGTHQELMDLGGEYAAMFTLQAAGYRAEAGEAA